jgi:pentatricopeptide repeat protein
MRYVKAGQYEKMMELFQKMQQAGMSPNRFTFLPALNACASLWAIEKGRCVHEEIIQSGYESDVIVGSSLIDMYAKCGSMEDAHSFQQDAHTECHLLDFYDSGICEMWGS